MGIGGGGEMVRGEVSVDVERMREVMYLVIDGKRFEERVGRDVGWDNLRGLKVVVE